MSTRTAPDCFKCRHLVITWQPNYPYACRAMGFKSGRMPWQEVVRASGMPCFMFTPKPAKSPPR